MRSDRCIEKVLNPSVATRRRKPRSCSSSCATSLLIVDTEPVDGNQIGITLSNGTALLVSLDQILLLRPPVYVVLD